MTVISRDLFMSMISAPNRRKLYQFVDARDRDEASAYDFSVYNQHKDMIVVNLPVNNVSKWTDHVSVVLNRNMPTVCFCNDGIKSCILGDYLGTLLTEILSTSHQSICCIQLTK